MNMDLQEELPENVLLSPAKNAKKLLSFAEKYRFMPQELWKKVIWSDESKFEL